MDNEKAVYSVYKITNTVNDKIYIGVHKTTNIHDSYLGSGKIIKEAVKKYGTKAFTKEILAVFDDSDSAYQLEKDLVNEDFINRDDTYNLIQGGSVSIDWTIDRIINQRQRLTGENHPFYGKHHTPESNARRSASLRGKKPSADVIERRAAPRRGKPSKLRGIPQSMESNEKRSHSHLILEKLTCPHCGVATDPGNAALWHFDNCKLVKPRETKVDTCPHCGKIGQLASMRRWHFDNCKSKLCAD